MTWLWIICAAFLWCETVDSIGPAGLSKAGPIVEMDIKFKCKVPAGTRKLLASEAMRLYTTGPVTAHDIRATSLRMQQLLTEHAAEGARVHVYHTFQTSSFNVIFTIEEKTSQSL